LEINVKEVINGGILEPLWNIICLFYWRSEWWSL